MVVCVAKVSVTCDNPLQQASYEKHEKLLHQASYNNSIISDKSVH